MKESFKTRLNLIRLSLLFHRIDHEQLHVLCQEAGHRIHRQHMKLTMLTIIDKGSISASLPPPPLQ